MRVAAYYPWIYLRGGGERTLLEFIRHSRHTWTIYTNRYDPEATFPEFRDIPLVELPRVSVKRNARDVGRAAFTLLSQELPFDDADALMICQESLGNLIGLRVRRMPVFCLCLTALRVAYDPHVRSRFLATRPSLWTRLGVSAFSLVDRLAWARYDRVFCISGEVASRLHTAHLTPEGRTEIVYPGVDLNDFRPDGAWEPFFLLPGRIMWTKNIELGIQAYTRLKTISPGAHRFRLVICGIVDEKSRPYLQKLRDMAGDRPDIEFVVDPSDQAFKQLYRRAFAVLFTAFNEDWGLVPLEAMASGRPVIGVAQGGPLESIAHGETGLLCPAEPEAFARAMASLAEDPGLADMMGRAGRGHVTRFSWDEFARPIDDYIDFLVGRSRRSAAVADRRAGHPS